MIIVSSGAIAVGLRRMNVEKRPKYLPRIQVGYYSSFMHSRGLLIIATGISSRGAMSAHESLGKPVRSSPAKSCADFAD